MKLFVKAFKDLTNQELYSMIKIREEVFVVEQNCVYVDCDGLDPLCDHILVTDDEGIIACLRIIPPNVKYDNVAIGRVVVTEKARFKGLGTMMMEESLAFIFKKYGDVDVTLSAQVVIKKLYESVGFKVVSDIYLEDGIDHVKMLREKGNPVFLDVKKEMVVEDILESAIYNDAIRNVKIEKFLEEAIVNDEFYLEFQPVIDIQTGLVSGHEALLRWNSKELGIISPDEFIPIAERTMIINSIGLFVLREACTFGRLIHQQFGKKHGMSVNVSLVQLKNAEFVDQVKEIIKTTDFDPKYLVLELTESFEFRKNHKMIEQIKKLINFGINISLDDFGTGYSALENVFLLPIQSLKIDKSVLWHSMNNHNGKTLIQSVIDFTNNAGIDVIVEGVETEVMEDQVKDFHSKFCQGYYYMRPSDKEAIIKNLKKEKDRKTCKYGLK